MDDQRPPRTILEDISLGARYVTDALRKDLTRTETQVEHIFNVVSEHDDLIRDQSKDLKILKKLGWGIIGGVWALFLAGLPVIYELINNHL